MNLHSRLRVNYWLKMTNFVNELIAISRKFVEQEDVYVCVLNGIQNYRKFCKVLKKSGTAYTVRKSSAKRQFGIIVLTKLDRVTIFSSQLGSWIGISGCKGTPRLLWNSENITYFGTPFTISNVILKNCVVGPPKLKKYSAINVRVTLLINVTFLNIFRQEST